MIDDKLSPRLVLSVLAIGLLGFTDIMLETALNVSFPMLMTEFKVTSSTVQWLTSGVILLTSMVVILSPWLKKKLHQSEPVYCCHGYIDCRCSD
jgi:hypothetical protein